MNLARLKSILSTALPFLVFCAVLSNFFVSCCVYRSSHPRFVFSHSEVTNYVYSVTTNFLSSPSHLVTNVLNSSVAPGRNEYTPKVVNGNYQYFVFSGRRCFRYFQHDYFEGDVSSLGLVLRIFPDKVFFHDGTQLVNIGSHPPEVIHHSKSKTILTERTSH